MLIVISHFHLSCDIVGPHTKAATGPFALLDRDPNALLPERCGWPREACAQGGTGWGLAFLPPPSFQGSKSSCTFPQGSAARSLDMKRASGALTPIILVPIYSYNLKLQTVCLRSYRFILQFYPLYHYCISTDKQARDYLQRNSNSSEHTQVSDLEIIQIISHKVLLTDPKTSYAPFQDVPLNTKWHFRIKLKCVFKKYMKRPLKLEELLANKEIRLSIDKSSHPWTPQ